MYVSHSPSQNNADGLSFSYCLLKQDLSVEDSNMAVGLVAAGFWSEEKDAGKWQ
jgi:hypothetical protein